MTLEILINILTFLFGLFIGHWLSIGRDKRKEFNEAAEKIATELIHEKQTLDLHCDFAYSINDSDFFHFRSRLYWWQRHAFDRALEKYKEKQNDHKNITSRESAINKLLAFTKRR